MPDARCPMPDARCRVTEVEPEPRKRPNRSSRATAPAVRPSYARAVRDGRFLRDRRGGSTRTPAEMRCQLVSRRGAAADQQATRGTTPNVARMRGTCKAGVKPVRPPDPVLVTSETKRVVRWPVVDSDQLGVPHFHGCEARRAGTRSTDPATCQSRAQVSTPRAPETRDARAAGSRRLPTRRTPIPAGTVVLVGGDKQGGDRVHPYCGSRHMRPTVGPSPGAANSPMSTNPTRS